MPIRDKGLGIELLTLRDLLDEEPSSAALDGATLALSKYRARVDRFEDSGRIKYKPVAGLCAVKYWVILDCGENKEDRHKPMAWPYDGRVERRPHRYLPTPVGADQEIWMVEAEEQGKALPGIYLSFDEACEVSSDLSAVCEIHEA